MKLTEINYDYRLIESINSVIKEEMGINRDVANATFGIYNLISDDFKSQKSQVIEDGVGIRKGCITYDLLGKEVYIQYSIKNFRDKEYLERYAERHGIETDGRSIVSYDKSKNCNKYITNGVWVYGISISGTIDRALLMDTIQHEIEHIFQQFKMNNDFGKDAVIGYVNNGISSEDEYERHMADIVYMSFKYEQEGFANGLYAYCKDDPIHYHDRFLTSPAYEKLRELKADREFIASHIDDEKLLTEIEKYKTVGITKDNVIETADLVIKQCIRRFSRVFCKVMKDINEKIRGRIIDEL
jgi:hypothetical protein